MMDAFFSAFFFFFFWVSHVSPRVQKVSPAVFLVNSVSPPDANDENRPER